MKSSFLKNCLALFLITLVAGFALAFVNELTSEPIKQAEYVAKMNAYEEVFKNSEFKEIDNAQNVIDKYRDDKNPAKVDEVLMAVDDAGNIKGYVFSATSPSGYGGDVKVALGISLEEGKITGFSVLSQSETAGLGARCTDTDFQNQFKDKFGKIILSKNSSSSSEYDSEIDAISGATITSNAVTEAVNAATYLFENGLKEGA